MDILISNSDKRPLYEQITHQLKNQILGGRLQAGEPLPSIRALAKDLRISVITTKRAYEELERDGFIVTTPGKGSFVAPKNMELVREERLKKVEGLLAEATEVARSSEIALQELIDLLKFYYENEG